MLILEENFKQHLETFALWLFYSIDSIHFLRKEEQIVFEKKNAQWTYGKYIFSR